MEVQVDMKAQITLRMKMIYAMTCDKYTICVASRYSMRFHFIFKQLFLFLSLFCSQQTIFRYLKFDFLVSIIYLYTGTFYL